MNKQQIEKEYIKYKKDARLRKAGKHSMDIAEHEKRVRRVQAWKAKDGVIRCKVELPQCYVNKTVRVICCEELE